MKTSFVAMTLLSVVPGILGLTIDTPTGVVQCQPIRINCHDGQPPYFMSVIPAGQPNAAAIKQFDQNNSGQLTWTPSTSGAVTLQCRDSTGQTAFSDAVNIQASSNTQCQDTVSIIGGSAASGSTPASTPTSAGSTPQTTGATTTGASSGSASSQASSSVRSSGTPSGTGANAATTSNAAGRINSGSFSLAGLLGIVGAAAFF